MLDYKDHTRVASHDRTHNEFHLPKPKRIDASVCRSFVKVEIQFHQSIPRSSRASSNPSSDASNISRKVSPRIDDSSLLNCAINNFKRNKLLTLVHARSNQHYRPKPTRSRLRDGGKRKGEGRENR